MILKQFTKKTKLLKQIGLGLLLALPILLVGFVFVLPFIKVFIISFLVEGEFSGNNYYKAIKLYSNDVIYTVFVSLCALFITTSIAVILGAYIRIYNDKKISFLLKIPLFIPFVVVGHAMKTFLAPHGLLNALLSVIGIVDLNNPPSIAFSTTGVIVALVWKNVAFAILLILAPFQGVKQSYVNAARNFGAGFFRITKDVLVPMTKSSILISMIIMFSSMMASFSVPLMMGNGQGRQMLMLDLYDQIIYQNNYGVANALGIISFILSIGSAYVYIKKVVKK